MPETKPMTSFEKTRFLGIEIGGTKLQVAVGTASGLVVEAIREAVPAGAGGRVIRRIILELSRRLIDAHAISGVGVGFGGPVDVESGKIARSHQVEGWERFSLRAWLQGALDQPVTVENDANTAALAEARLGSGKGRNPVFYVTLGSGVGGGLVADGRIYHGRAPGESEIGHLRLSPGGPIVESLCSGWALDRRLRELAEVNPESELARLLANVKSGEATQLPKAIEAGDRHARAALNETAESLAQGLSHVAHLFHPAIIVIGGGLSHLGDLLLNPTREYLESNIMEALLPAPLLRAASLGEEVVPVGAILLAADQAAGKT
jgi:glucokinase